MLAWMNCSTPFSEYSVHARYYSTASPLPSYLRILHYIVLVGHADASRKASDASPEALASTVVGANILKTGSDPALKPDRWDSSCLARCHDHYHQALPARGSL